jgi:hypothetical protein
MTVNVIKEGIRDLKKTKDPGPAPIIKVPSLN